MGSFRYDDCSVRRTDVAEQREGVIAARRQDLSDSKLKGYSLQRMQESPCEVWSGGSGIYPSTCEERIAVFHIQPGGSMGYGECRVNTEGMGGFGTTTRA